MNKAMTSVLATFAAVALLGAGTTAKDTKGTAAATKAKPSSTKPAQSPAPATTTPAAAPAPTPMPTISVTPTAVPVAPGQPGATPPAPAGPGGTLELKERSWDAGKVERGSPISHAFILKNIGKYDLTVDAKPG